MTSDLMGSINEFRSQFPAQSPEIQRFRDQGVSRFSETGMPSRHDEEWHYTSVKSLADKTFELALLRPVQPVPKISIKHLSDDFINLVFVDGRFADKLSDLRSLQAQASVKFITERVDFKLSADPSNFEALNCAYVQQGVCIEIPENVVVDKPVQIVSYVSANAVMTHPRGYVVVGKNSKLSLLETFSGVGAQYFQNSFLEARIMDSAKLEYVRIQDETKSSFNIGKTQFLMEDQSVLESLSFSVGAKLSRHDLSVCFQGSGCSATVNGVALGAGEQHIDHNTLIDHHSGACSSSQLYKAVLAGKSRSVFTGKVLIRKDSQKASSEQLNNSLLLSNEAEADSRPQLEILADDVKATHGSTVGHLDEEEIFYLVSRAIPRTEAIEMLSLGFLQELIFRLSHLQIQGFLNQLLTEAYLLGGKS
jgi:Fe-S cluster assembly protein SufD